MNKLTRKMIGFAFLGMAMGWASAWLVVGLTTEVVSPYWEHIVWAFLLLIGILL